VIEAAFFPDDIARDVGALRDNPRIADILDDVCRLTGMGFAAVARVTDERWVACQVLDRIEFGLKPGDELVLKTTICAEIRESGQAVIIDHVGDEPTGSSSARCARSTRNRDGYGRRRSSRCWNGSVVRSRGS
jgi:hypothetical protein